MKFLPLTVTVFILSSCATNWVQTQTVETEKAGGTIVRTTNTKQLGINWSASDALRFAEYMRGVPVKSTGK